MRQKKPQYTSCEHNIFWNTYAQECAFRGLRRKVPDYVAKTCAKLFEKYPHPNEAEWFIRAQFAVKVEDSEYEVLSVVLQFSHLIHPRHDITYQNYHKYAGKTVGLLLTNAVSETRGTYSTDPAQWTPLARYLKLSAESDEETQEAVARKCLQWPLLAERLNLTEHLKIRIRDLRNEVRLPELKDGQFIRHAEKVELLP